MTSCSRLLSPLLVLALAAPAVRASSSDENAPKAHPAPAATGSAPTAKPATTGNPSQAPAATVLASHHSRADTGLFALDLVLDLMQVGVEIAALSELESRAPPPPEDTLALDDRPLSDDGVPPPGFRVQRRVRRQHEARQGFLLAFGLGGDSLDVTGVGKTGAFDVDFRMGYGFSDRFQFFGDVTADAADFGNGRTATSWLLTLRGQTVLIGDREGNGLNLNAGIGMGGLSRSYQNDPNYSESTGAGLAFAGGLSYDARVGRSFSLSPELFASWHAVPNPGFKNDIATTVGLRLNFLWYSP